MMHGFGFGLVMLCGLELVRADDPSKVVPKYKLGPDTTFVMGPLDKDGYINFEAAVNERLRGKITPETNANVLLWQAIGPKNIGQEMHADYFGYLGVKPPADGGVYFIELKQHVPAKLDDDEGNEKFQRIESHIRSRPWTAKEFPAHAGWLSRNEKPLVKALEASKRPDYFNPLCSRDKDGKPGMLIGGLLLNLGKYRSVVQALATRAMLKLGEGKPDAAWDDLLAAHRLSRHIASGGCLIELMVGFAGESVTCAADLAFIAHCGFNAEKLQACQKALASLPAMSTQGEKVTLAERIRFLDCVQAVRREGFDSVRDGSPKKLDAEQKRKLDLFDWEAVMKTGNGWYDRFAEASKHPTRSERHQKMERIEIDLLKMKARLKDDQQIKQLVKTLDPLLAKRISQKIGELMIGLLAPAVMKIQDSTDRLEQQQRNLRIAFALAAYHKETGQYPATLGDLSPKYLDKVPDDLFATKPLIYKPDDKGYLLYSVGENGMDDGGQAKDDNLQCDDLVIRMPLPPVRK